MIPNLIFVITSVTEQLYDFIPIKCGYVILPVLRKNRFLFVTSLRSKVTGVSSYFCHHCFPVIQNTQVIIQELYNI